MASTASGATCACTPCMTRSTTSCATWAAIRSPASTPSPAPTPEPQPSRTSITAPTRHQYTMQRRSVLQWAAGSAAATALPSVLHAAEPLKELRLDYAYYSPSSLVIRRFGWLEEEFKKDGINVKWVLSAGSNRALEYLNGISIDIGSTAGLAALLAKANGNPIRAPYIFSRPEWTA